MNIKKTITLLSISSCLAFQATHAGNLPQDPRSLGMGGTGVAVANSAQAQFYNPSLLVNAKENEDFNFEIFANGRLADPNNLQSMLLDFSEKDYITNFVTALDDFNATLADNTLLPASKISTLETQVVTLTAASEDLQGGLRNLSDRSLSVNANGGIMTSVPSNKLGWAAYLNVWADAGVTFNLGKGDDQILTDFIAIPNAIISDLTSGNPVDVAANPIDQLDSTITLNAVFVREIGVSLAMPYKVNNYAFDVGITPKLMSIQAFGYEQTLQESESEAGQIDPTVSNNYNSFNVDMGISKQLNDNWKSGLVIQNLIPRSFKTPSTSGSEIQIKPEVRVGTVYQYSWATVAADFDLTQNVGPASGLESRYLSVGAELDLWLAKLRLGYRANLAAENNNTTSAGLGLYLFGLNIDAAVAAGQGAAGPNDVNAALQIGLQW